MEINGTLAFCPQQPWIVTDTILGNIVFHQKLDEERLNSVLRSCGLDRDVVSFPAGVQTEIGEKGVNLSVIYINLRAGRKPGLRLLEHCTEIRKFSFSMIPYRL